MVRGTPERRPGPERTCLAPRPPAPPAAAQPAHPPTQRAPALLGACSRTDTTRIHHTHTHTHSPPPPNEGTTTASCGQWCCQTRAVRTTTQTRCTSAAASMWRDWQRVDKQLA